jgi:hypothetical protein
MYYGQNGTEKGPPGNQCYESDPNIILERFYCNETKSILMPIMCIHPDNKLQLQLVCKSKTIVSF